LPFIIVEVSVELDNTNRGIKRPLFKEKRSNIEELLGVSVPIPTCAKIPETKTSASPRNIFLSIIVFQS